MRLHFWMLFKRLWDTTCHYSFLVVKTNVNCGGMGSFIIQSETTAAIWGLLAISNYENDTWKPWYFLTDFCLEKIQTNTIKQTFTGRELIIKIENALTSENNSSHLEVA